MPNRIINKKTQEAYSSSSDLVKTEILGVGITNASKENILEYITNSLKKNTKPYYIVTPNPEMIALAHKNSDFKTILNQAKIALNDGVGMGVGALVMGKRLGERFTGVELVEKLCERANDWPITIGFLGAGPNVAEMTAECLRRRYPNLKIVFADDHWPEESSVAISEEARSKKQEARNEDQNKKPLILNSKFLIPNIDVLFVALGVPKQERWMASYVGKIPVKVMVGVGGAFDYISGKVPRAPKLVRDLGFEWLFRLIIQPWRLKRQFALIKFTLLVVKQKLSSHKAY